MNRFLLVLLSSPALLASLASVLVTASPIGASTPMPATNEDLSCILSRDSNGFSCLRVTKEIASASDAFDSDPTPMLDITDEESDEAIAKYGCDCTGCIRSLRQSEI